MDHTGDTSVPTTAVAVSSSPDILSPGGKSRYGRTRRPKIAQDFYNIDDVFIDENPVPRHSPIKSPKLKPPPKSPIINVEPPIITEEAVFDIKDEFTKLDDLGMKVANNFKTNPQRGLDDSIKERKFFKSLTENKMEVPNVPDVNKVFKLISTKSSISDIQETKTPHKSMVKTYSNKRKHVCDSEGFSFESFGLPDEPIIPASSPFVVERNTKIDIDMSCAVDVNLPVSWSFDEYATPLPLFANEPNDYWNVDLFSYDSFLNESMKFDRVPGIKAACHDIGKVKKIKNNTPVVPGCDESAKVVQCVRDIKVEENSEHAEIKIKKRSSAVEPEISSKIGIVNDNDTLRDITHIIKDASSINLEEIIPSDEIESSKETKKHSTEVKKTEKIVRVIKKRISPVKKKIKVKSPLKVSQSNIDNNNIEVKKDEEEPPEVVSQNSSKSSATNNNLKVPVIPKVKYKTQAINPVNISKICPDLKVLLNPLSCKNYFEDKRNLVLNPFKIKRERKRKRYHDSKHKSKFRPVKITEDSISYSFVGNTPIALKKVHPKYYNPPEQVQVKAEDFDIKNIKTESIEFQVGDLAWAKIGSHPYWPCMVTQEPISGDHKKFVVKRPQPLYHVRFFGDNGRRSWVTEQHIMLFFGRDDLEKVAKVLKAEDKVKSSYIKECYKIKPAKLPKWQAGVGEAEALQYKSLQERLDYFFDIFASKREKQQKLKELGLLNVKSEVEETSDKRKRVRLSEVEHISKKLKRDSVQITSEITLKESSEKLIKHDDKEEIKITKKKESAVSESPRKVFKIPGIHNTSSNKVMKKSENEVTKPFKSPLKPKKEGEKTESKENLEVFKNPEAPKKHVKKTPSSEEIIVLSSPEEPKKSGKIIEILPSPEPKKKESATPPIRKKHDRKSQISDELDVRKKIEINEVQSPEQSKRKDESATPTLRKKTARKSQSREELDVSRKVERSEIVSPEEFKKKDESATPTMRKKLDVNKKIEINEILSPEESKKKDESATPILRKKTARKSQLSGNLDVSKKVASSEILSPEESKKKDESATPKLRKKHVNKSQPSEELDVIKKIEIDEILSPEESKKKYESATQILLKKTARKSQPREELDVSKKVEIIEILSPEESKKKNESATPTLRKTNVRKSQSREELDVSKKGEIIEILSPESKKKDESATPILRRKTARKSQPTEELDVSKKVEINEILSPEASQNNSKKLQSSDEIYVEDLCLPSKIKGRKTQTKEQIVGETVKDIRKSTIKETIEETTKELSRRSGKETPEEITKVRKSQTVKEITVIRRGRSSKSQSEEPTVTTPVQRRTLKKEEFTEESLEARKKLRNPQVKMESAEPSPIPRRESQDKKTKSSSEEQQETEENEDDAMPKVRNKRHQLGGEYSNSDTDSKFSDNSSVPTSLESQAALYKRNNIFRGVSKEKVCQVCEQGGDVFKCKGPCNGVYHYDCAMSPTKDKDKEDKEKKEGGKLEVKTDELKEEKNNVEIISVNSTKPLPNLSDSPNYKGMTLAEKIDFRMKEIMKKFDYQTMYAESTDSSSEELIVEESADKGKNQKKLSITVTNKPTKKEVPIIKHVTADNVSYICVTNEPPKDKEVATAIRNTLKCTWCLGDVKPNCLVCGKEESKSGVKFRQKCSLHQCGKYYHPECLKVWPQTQWSLIQSTKDKNTDAKYDTFVCPRHVCHTCISDDPRAANSRCPSDKVVKCLKCPATYHSSSYCVPAGTEILSTTQIVCPRHYNKAKLTKKRTPLTINTNWCFICSKGGNLICCETCPTSVHVECLPGDLNEDDTFFCEDCQSGRLPLYDEIVWVKLGTFRWWPALILFPNEVPDNVRNIKHNKGEFVVKFFGTYDHYWVGRGRTFLFQEGDKGHSHSIRKRVDNAFVKAIEEAAAAHQLKKQFKLNKVAEKNSGLKPPPYIRIKVNKPVGNVRLGDGNTSNTTSCDCDPNQPHPCGPDSDCLNRLLLTECNPEVCLAGDRCNNQCFEKREYPPLVPHRTQVRGWGLKTLAPIRKGQFVIEYVGEIIDEQEYQRRIQKMHEQKEENYYFLTIDKDRTLDAGPKGNVARFMNHSCQPNCETQKWTVNGNTRVGLFAKCDIPADTELTFNYNLECIGKEKKICKCGAPNCSGFIGVKVKQDASAKKSTKPRKKKPTPPSEIVNIENPCFVCGKVGDVGVCNNKICTKYYHLECVALKSWPEGNKWVCQWHNCNICSKRTIRCCVKCLNSYCPSHSEGNVRYDKLLGFVCFEHDPTKETNTIQTTEISPKGNASVNTEEGAVTSTTSDEVEKKVGEDEELDSMNLNVRLNDCVTSTPLKKSKEESSQDESTVSSASTSVVKNKSTKKRKSTKRKVVKKKVEVQVNNTANAFNTMQNEIKLSNFTPVKYLRTSRSSTRMLNSTDPEKDLPIRKRTRLRCGNTL